MPFHCEANLSHHSTSLIVSSVRGMCFSRPLTKYAVSSSPQEKVPPAAITLQANTIFLSETGVDALCMHGEWHEDG